MYKTVKQFIITFFFTLIFYTGFNKVGYGQLAQNFTDYTIVDGLPDNKITALAQDKYGYVWVGTGNGLARFDGKYFTNISAFKNLMQLPSPEIIAIKNLDSNHLGIVTNRGLSIIDVTNMSSYNVTIPKGSNKLKSSVNNLRDVLHDESGNLYIISKTGFYHYNKERKLSFRYDDYLTEGPTQGVAFGAYSFWLNENSIVIKGRNSFFRYDISKKKLFKFAGEDDSFLFSIIAKKFQNNPDHFLLPIAKGKAIILDYKSDSLIYFDETNRIITKSKIYIPTVSDLFTWRSKLYCKNDSTFFICGKFKGIYTLRLQTTTGKLFLDTTPTFPDKKANYFFTDGLQKLWLGFSDGLMQEKSSPINLRIKNPKLSNAEMPKIGHPLLQVAVTDKFIYGASAASGGLHQFDKNSLTFEKTIPFNFPPFGNKSLFALKKWVGDTVLCGTDAGLFLYNEKIGKAHYINMPGWEEQKNFIIDFFIDRNENVWITTNKGAGCYIWKPGTPNPVWFSTDSLGEKKITEIYHVTEDIEGNIWIAGNGVLRYNINKKVIDISIQNFAEEQSEVSSFDAIAVDKNGGIWLANGYGSACLVLYQPATKNTTVFTVKDGLPDFKAHSLTYYKGYIYIVSKNGISKINCDTKKIEIITSVKDVFYQHFYSSSLVYDNTSNYFFTSAGTSIIRFEAENKNYKNKSPVLLLEYIINGKDSTAWFPPNHINLSWDNRNITLFYNAINFEDPEYQKFAYRIIRNNYPEEWIAQEDQRRIVLSDLKPGKTSIEIKVFSTKNAWPEKIIRYNIKVTPPFWKTNWFLLLCIATLFVFLYSLYKYRAGQIKKMAAIRENISKDLHDEIGATLSGIGMYSHLVKSNLDRNEVVAAAHSVNIIQGAAAAMVSQLNDIIWIIKPQNELLETIINRLEIFSSELCAAKNINAYIESDAASKKCKPRLEVRKNIYLFCKEAINNAVKYSNAKQLSLSFSLKGDILKIIIEDDGIGYDADTIKKGNGLDNMQKRAKDIRANLTIITNPGKGCQVQLIINITP